MTLALKVTGLTKTYHGRAVLDGVDLGVSAGSVVCLVGQNGSGKTTLVECVEGIRRPDAGSIEIFGQPYPYGRKRPARLGVQLQEESLPSRIRVGEALEFFRRIYGCRPPATARLAALGVAQLLRKPFVTLSGGQKRRVVVALALVGDPRLVVLDEPLAGLDPGGQDAVLDLITMLRDDGVGVLVTVHDLESAAALADRITVLAAGRVIVDGPPADLVAALGATAVAVLPAALELTTATLGELGVRRLVRHAQRQYAYGGADLLDHVAAAGGLTRLAQRGAEFRDVSLLDVYACAAGETVYDVHDARHARLDGEVDR
jgi:ABC-2 type transport system ATP-binding protein